jgi:L-rhamnose mutarotase
VYNFFKKHLNIYGKLVKFLKEVQIHPYSLIYLSACLSSTYIDT